MGRDQRTRYAMFQFLRACGMAGVILLLTSSAIACTTAASYPGGGVSDTARPTPPDDPADDNSENDNPNVQFGQLPNPPLYYRDHGGEFYDIVKHAPWHGHYRDRNCVGCASGEYGRLKIQAIGNAQAEKITGFSSQALVRGRVINVGHRQDATTNIKAQDGLFAEADEVYYVITDDHDPNAATLWVARLSFSWPFHTPKKEMSIERADKKYRKCQHDEPKWGKKTEGDFHTCARPTGETYFAMPWFSCDAGCCTSEWAAPAQ